MFSYNQNQCFRGKQTNVVSCTQFDVQVYSHSRYRGQESRIINVNQTIGLTTAMTPDSRRELPITARLGNDVNIVCKCVLTTNGPID